MDQRFCLRDAVPVLVRVAGELARYCDRTEHNEAADRAAIVRAGSDARELALRLFAAVGQDPMAAYAARIRRVEARYPLGGSGAYDGGSAVDAATTWRLIQQAQAHHDAIYHADVAGLAKIEQLRHYTLHMAKLAWLMQEAANDSTATDEFIQNRLPDILLFGIKLATVVGINLPDEPIRQ